MLETIAWTANQLVPDMGRIRLSSKIYISTVRFTRLAHPGHPQTTTHPFFTHSKFRFSALLFSTVSSRDYRRCPPASGVDPFNNPTYYCYNIIGCLHSTSVWLRYFVVLPWSVRPQSGSMLLQKTLFFARSCTSLINRSYVTGRGSSDLIESHPHIEPDCLGAGCR